MTNKVKLSIQQKIYIQSIFTALPFLILVVFLIVSIVNYNKTNEAIVSSMTVANNYNLNFKEEMDESLYKIVVGYTDFDAVGEDPTLKDPYKLLSDLRKDFKKLELSATQEECKIWLTSLLRNIDTLEKRVGDIKENLKTEGSYSQNIEMLDSDIYILTELIQEDIQHYLFYQTQNMEIVTDQLQQRMQRLVVLCSAVVVLLILLVGTATVMIVTGILRPIKSLYNATNEVATGNFKTRADVTTNDELAVLANGFNNMAQNMQNLIDEIKEDEQKLRKMDLRLLQEQINPHFLYNTLDTIVWLIESEQSEQAVEMVVELSNFFRIVLSKGKALISIQEEEKHIRSYLDIQKVRYGDIMEYDISIDKVLYEYQILKLTLQPLVENALYHGIKYKRAKGYVHITGEKEGELIRLVVRDNGVGMSQDELEELRVAINTPCKETTKGFGLANVNERIRTFFGQQYGMTITSEKDHGTIIEVVIPALKGSEVVDEEGNNRDLSMFGTLS